MKFEDLTPCWNSATIETHMPRWDIFCTVVDNFGDIGVCWRLAQQLADEHSADVRLWVDNLERFACLCPSVKTDANAQQVGAVDVRRWDADFAAVEATDVADVVIEAFACEIPAPYIAAMKQRSVPPVWINLEYLSAEEWVEGCHLLKSPQSGSRLAKRFFFPGFTAGTGGLLRERGLLAARAAFDAAATASFWKSLNLPASITGELRISLFCYENPALPELLQCWTEGPGAIRLLVTPGAAARQTADWFGDASHDDWPLSRGTLTVHALPFLSQPRYDRLLWACDVNFVRGEDSFVRAQWAQRPFVWQIYPQAADAHLVKLQAFLQRYLGDSPNPEPVRNCWRAWNCTGAISMRTAWREYAALRQVIEQHGKVWAGQLDQTTDLANNLARFVRES